MGNLEAWMRGDRLDLAGSGLDCSESWNRRGDSGKLREKMAQDSAMGRVRRLVSVYPAVTVDPQE